MKDKRGGGMNKIDPIIKDEMVEVQEEWDTWHYECSINGKLVKSEPHHYGFVPIVIMPIEQELPT